MAESASAFEQVGLSADTLLEALQQLQSRSASQNNVQLEKEVDLLIHALPDMVNLLKDNLPVTTSAQAPAIGTSPFPPSPSPPSIVEL